MAIHNESSKCRTIRKRNRAEHKRRRYDAIANSAFQQEKVANYQPNDLNKFHLGEDWFNNGMKLDEAPEELKTNHNFVKGFLRAERIQNIALQQYEMGVEFCRNGIPVEQIPERYRNNPNIIKGYNDASKKRNGR